MIKEILIKIYRTIFHKFIHNYTNELKLILSDCKSILDVGCGSSSPIKNISHGIYKVGVDAFKPSIIKSKKQHIHNKYYNMSVLKIYPFFKSKSFDCVLASDLIEHLSKKEGLKLIDMMEKIAKKKVIIFTPNGFLHQGEYDNNPWQVHKSGWCVKEMENKGYSVIGINGYKNLRGEFAAIKYKPALLWEIISMFSQPFVRNKPKKAFQILCVKNLSKNQNRSEI